MSSAPLFRVHTKKIHTKKKEQKDKEMSLRKSMLQSKKEQKDKEMSLRKSMLQSAVIWSIGDTIAQSCAFPRVARRHIGDLLLLHFFCSKSFFASDQSPKVTLIHYFPQNVVCTPVQSTHKKNTHKKKRTKR
ncbi:Hypothetical protein, putative [Bodo saltans]|uniref:Uncharacterized protein n=1 Tax=Bodo saltans TaxID=75058 RepID=A0A0S4IYW6_BODSA|nr:Hypothetical protein, putative [Bodo saltans]|eukprot:CUG25235.1 Hypothetical protein, putative [Bodo saltans]